MGYSPWGRKELDMTERLTFPLSPSQKLGTDICLSSKPHPGADAREPPRDSPVIAEMRAFVSCMA